MSWLPWGGPSPGMEPPFLYPPHLIPTSPSLGVPDPWATVMGLSSPWQAHMEAVHAEWKEYLNLLICEESHLKYMEDYHQVPVWLQARERVQEFLGACRASLTHVEV